MRILVIDDEPEMAAVLERGLAGDGHEVTAVGDGIAALEAFHAAGGPAADTDAASGGAASGAEGAGPDTGFQAAVVDVMLPGMSGFELTRRLKELRPGLMVILLTARDAVDDRVRGLDAGADDYLTKPFHFAELAARIRAIQRRDALAAPQSIEVGPIVLDLTRNRARLGRRELALSRTEFDVLRVFAANAGTPVTRQQLLDEVWDTGRHIDGNVVDQYLSYVRRKLAEYETGLRITTRRGVGFTLVVDG
jgi:two-component system, OmpR family, response regulator